jgi:hypothetical protein
MFYNNEKIQGLHLLKFGNILIGMSDKTRSPLKTLTQQNDKIICFMQPNLDSDRAINTTCKTGLVKDFFQAQGTSVSSKTQLFLW